MAGQRGDVFDALAQCWQWDREHIQAVVEVFAKLLVRHRFQQVLVGGGDHPHVHLALTRVADRLDHPFLQGAQDLGLQRQGHIPHFVEKQRALVGLHKAPYPVGHGAGKRALAMAEHFAFQQAFGDRRAVDRHKRLVCTVAMLVNGAGDHFFAGAAFAGQQDGGVAFTHRIHRLQHSAKRRAFPDQAIELGMFIELGTQPCVVAHDVAKLQSLGHGDVQLVDIEGLGNVVVGAVTHGLHGIFHGAVGRHHDHRQLRVAHLDLGQQLRAVHAGHAPVADHQVDVLLLQHLERMQAIAGDKHLDMVLAQGRRQQIAELGLVVDHQYVMCHDCPRRRRHLHRWPECTG